MMRRAGSDSFWPSERHYTITYGGGAAGLIKALADGALSRGGRITGVISKFMNELE